MVGLLGAMVVDSAVLANEPDKSVKSSSFRVMPVVGIGRTDGQVGVVGEF